MQYVMKMTRQQINIRVKVDILCLILIYDAYYGRANNTACV